MENVRESKLTPLHDTYALTTMISKMEDLTAVIWIYVFFLGHVLLS